MNLLSTTGTTGTTEKNEAAGNDGKTELTAIIKSEVTAGLDFFPFREEQHAFLEERHVLGYHPQSIYVSKFLDQLVGHSWDDLIKEAKKKARQSERSEKAYHHTAEIEKEWRELCASR